MSRECSGKDINFYMGRHFRKILKETVRAQCAWLHAFRSQGADISKAMRTSAAAWLSVCSFPALYNREGHVDRSELVDTKPLMGIY